MSEYNRAIPGPILYQAQLLESQPPSKDYTRKAASIGREVVGVQVGNEIFTVEVPSGLSDKEIIRRTRQMADVDRFILKKRPFRDYFFHYMRLPSWWFRWGAYWPFILGYSAYVLILSIVWSIRIMVAKDDGKAQRRMP
ncbi:MAG: hypothetical protein ACE5I0_11005 [Candidatus Binatia bacterium]